MNNTYGEFRDAEPAREKFLEVFWVLPIVLQLTRANDSKKGCLEASRKGVMISTKMFVIINLIKSIKALISKRTPFLPSFPSGLHFDKSTINSLGFSVKVLQ